MTHYGVTMVVCATALTISSVSAQMTAPGPIVPTAPGPIVPGPINPTSWKCAGPNGRPIYTSAKEDTLTRDCEVASADWWPFTYTDSLAGYYNFDSLATEKDKWKMWFMWDNRGTTTKMEFPPYKDYQSSKTLWLFDCKARKFATIQAAYYSGGLGSGDNVANFSIGSESAALTDAIPGTTGVTMLNIACNLAGSRTAAPKVDRKKKP